MTSRTFRTLLLLALGALLLSLTAPAWAGDVNAGTVYAADKVTGGGSRNSPKWTLSGKNNTFDLGSATFTLSAALASQTTERKQMALTLSTDSTYITGTNITYSSARGSSLLNLVGTYSGLNGGYSNLYSIVNSTRTQTNANAGIVAVKQVINNTVAQTAGNFTAVQGIAKHNHASAKVANAAPMIGVEGVANQSAAGQIGTAIGVSAAYHIPADAAVFDGGAVWRGLQITLDNASENNPSEESGLVIWNMAGTQTNAIKLVKSDHGFLYDLVGQNNETWSNATNGAWSAIGAINFAPAGGTPVISVGALGGAGTSDSRESLGAGGAGTRGLSFYLSTTSITAAHDQDALYMNMDYGTGATDPAPSGDVIRGRAYLKGDASGGNALTGVAGTVELDSTGASNTGLTAGMRGNIVLPSGVMTKSGTYAGTMAEVFLGGNAVNTTAYTQIAPLAVVIGGTNPTASSQLSNMAAINFTFPSNMVGAGELFVGNSNLADTCEAKMAVTVNGVRYWLMLSNNDD